MHRASAFFSWLLAQHPADAEAFRSFGLPPTSSRLFVLLRACKHETEKLRVRRWHRRWRIHRKFEELERTGQIKRISIEDSGPLPPFDDSVIHGFKRSGTITFEVRFDTLDRMLVLSRILNNITPERWDRVVRRWEAKHL